MTVYIDPAYKVYYNNELFNPHNAILNRDDTLSPFIRMRAALNEKNIEVHTADRLIDGQDNNLSGDYYSFGLMDNLDALARRNNVHLKSFILSEPPVVAPHLYKALPKLTQLFENVYVHNIHGDGYSLRGVDQSKLKKFYYSQPHDDVIEPYWHKVDRLKRIVVINGNHKPKSYAGELYSKRIDVMVQLAAWDCVDLFGRGWNRWWSRDSLWRAYWANVNTLKSIYKGPCECKFTVLSQYDFSLCFENMHMQGYVTEKIFDCFYAGTVPIYWGAKDIRSLIPENAYIDFREFDTVQALKNHVFSLSQAEILSYKQAARDFIKSPQGLNYYHSIKNIVTVDA